MNGIKLGLAALICAGTAITATAEPIMTSAEEASLKVIMADTCTEPVMFVPLSEDIDIEQRIYAVVPAAEADPGSAHLVSAAERNWLVSNGCSTKPDLMMASNETRNPELN